MSAFHTFAYDNDCCGSKVVRSGAFIVELPSAYTYQILHIPPQGSLEGDRFLAAPPLTLGAQAIVSLVLDIVDTSKFALALDGENDAAPTMVASDRTVSYNRIAIDVLYGSRYKRVVCLGRALPFPQRRSRGLGRRKGRCAA